MQQVKQIDTISSVRSTVYGAGRNVTGKQDLH